MNQWSSSNVPVSSARATDPRLNRQYHPGSGPVGPARDERASSGLGGRFRAYAVFLGVFGGALAAASVSTAHEAEAAGHADPGSDDVVTPLASISHAFADDRRSSAGDASPDSRLLPVREPAGGGASDELSDLNKSVRVNEDRAAAAAEAARERAAKEREAQRNRVVWPVEGEITSKPGARWGLTHYGLDIANSIGTPIRAVKRGTVIEAGSASGFGLWVRLQHDDGTITVYGHINRALVSEGERVEAGDTIAEVGNRGQSTGPHLHFEVWDADSRKINPLAWLQRNGARP